MALPLIAVTVMAASTRITVTKDTEGTMSHVTNYVTESGQSVFSVDDAGAVTFWATNILPTSGSSIYAIGESGPGYYVIYNSKSSVTGTETLDATKLTGAVPAASIPDPITSGVSSVNSPITGRAFVINMTSSETLSGNSLFGGVIGNYGATSEVTATAIPVTNGMNVFFQTRVHGKKLFIKLDAIDSIWGADPGVTTGASAFLLDGGPASAWVLLNYCAPNAWCVSSVSAAYTVF